MLISSFCVHGAVSCGTGPAAGSAPEVSIATIIVISSGASSAHSTASSTRRDAGRHIYVSELVNQPRVGAEISERDHLADFGVVVTGCAGLAVAASAEQPAAQPKPDVAFLSVAVDDRELPGGARR